MLSASPRSSTSQIYPTALLCAKVELTTEYSLPVSLPFSLNLAQVDLLSGLVLVEALFLFFRRSLGVCLLGLSGHFYPESELALRFIFSDSLCSIYCS